MLKEIPGTHGFLASSAGEIFGPDGTERNYYRNLDGYKTASVLYDSAWITFGVHRLVALAHLDCPGDPKEYTVNHKDFDKCNNNAGNLEWVSVKDNNIHASLMQGTGELILWKYGRDIDSIICDGLVTAAEIVGSAVDLVWKAVVNRETLSGYTVEFFGRKDRLPEHLKKPPIPRRDLTGRIPVSPVKMKDIVTGEVVVYPTMTAAATAHGVLTGHLTQVASAETLRLFKKRYLVAYCDKDFPEASAEALEVASGRGPKEVVAFNSESGSFQIHESAASFIRTNGISKKAVTTRLKRDGELQVVSRLDNWHFAYMTDEIVQQFKHLIEVPAI